MRTLYEALNLVPGMELYLARHGFWNTMVGGAAEVFATGNMKILLDGVPLITAFGIEPMPNMPVEQVDRIEVIRGPGQHYLRRICSQLWPHGLLVKGFSSLLV